jgi:hypothetical protein
MPPPPLLFTMFIPVPILPTLHASVPPCTHCPLCYLPQQSRVPSPHTSRLHLKCPPHSHPLQ